MKKLMLLVGALAATAALSSCSKTPTRDDVKAVVQKAGVPSSAVDCVTDKMIAKFGVDRLGTNDNPTSEETQAMATIIIDCNGVPTSTPAGS